jgi:hypothetical protein
MIASARWCDNVVPPKPNNRLIALSALQTPEMPHDLGQLVNLGCGDGEMVAEDPPAGLFGEQAAPFTLDVVR